MEETIGAVEMIGTGTANESGRGRGRESRGRRGNDRRVIASVIGTMTETDGTGTGIGIERGIRGTTALIGNLPLVRPIIILNERRQLMETSSWWETREQLSLRSVGAASGPVGAHERSGWVPVGLFVFRLRDSSDTYPDMMAAVMIVEGQELVCLLDDDDCL